MRAPTPHLKMGPDHLCAPGWPAAARHQKGQPAWRHSDGIPKRKVCFTQNQPRGDAFLWRPHYPPSSHISLCQRHKRYERSSSHHRDPAQAWRYPNCSISSSPNPVSNVLLPILVQLLKANARLGKLYVRLHKSDAACHLANTQIARPQCQQ